MKREGYRPVLMWFWNAVPTEREISRQIAGFRRQGIRDFFVHAAYGLEIPYLSDRFMELVGHAVRKAAARGMRFWIYDEYGWPSGTAGGLVLRDHPEARMSLLLYGRHDVAPGATITPAAPGQAVASYLLAGDRWERVADPVDGQAWTNPMRRPASLLVFRQVHSKGVHPSAKWSSDATWEQGSVDACSPEAIRRFIDLTHERYRGVAGPEFGKTIRGSFTDEPVLSTGWVLDFPAPYVGLPWHRTLLDAFREEYGYDLAERLPELALPVGSFRRTRCDYWRHLSRRFRESFTGQLGAWCRAHGISLTGHVNCEESFDGAMLTSGDLFEALRDFDIPGADSVSSKLYLDVDHTVLPPRAASSVGHALGRRRVLCETFTGSGWDLSLTDMKRIADRMSVLGVSMLQLMGAYYSVKGFRRLPPDASWPPSHNYQNAQWPHFGLFTSYVDRVYAANAAGRHAARVAVLYPIASAWTLYRFDHYRQLEADPHYRGDWTRLDATFAALNRALLESQVDFDWVFEQSLAEARIARGSLAVGRERYDAVILPACRTLRTPTPRVLARFAAAGGTLVFLNGVPEHGDDGRSLPRAFRTAMGLEVESVNRDVAECWQAEAPVLRTAAGNPNVTALTAVPLDRAHREPLRRALRDLLPPQCSPVQFTPESADLWIALREVRGRWQACVANTAATPWEGAVSVPPADRVELERPGTSVRETIDGDSLRLQLAPYELVFLRAVPAARGGSPGPSLQPASAGTIEIKGPWRMVPEGGNLLPLALSVRPDEPDAPLALAGAAAADPASFAATADGRFIAGREPLYDTGSGWGQMGGRHPLTSFAPGSSWWVRSEFSVDTVPADLELLVEDLGIETAALNGTALGRGRRCRAWDESNRAYPLAAVARPGANVLLLRVRVPAWRGPHALPLVVLRGTFEVPDPGRLAAPRPDHRAGDWAREGFPGFSGAMRYATTVRLGPEELEGDAVLSIARVAEVAEVRVNGRPVGEPRAWPPYEFPLGGTLVAGENEIEVRVTSTSANLLGGGSPSGIIGTVVITRRTRQ